MVKILSTGEIVADDDPRAGQASPRGGASAPRQGPRQGFVRHDDNGQQGMMGQQVSIFDALNQRLLAMGIPRFNIGQFPVEPIVLVGFCLAGLLLGVKGLIFGAVLFAVAKMSSGHGFPGFGGHQGGGQNRQGGGQGHQGGGGGGSTGGGGGGGGGHRLGRS